MKIRNLHRMLLTGLSICAFHAQGQQSPANVEARVNQILSQMTLDEKLSYIGGTGFFDIKPIPVPNLNVAVNPQIFQTDGPLGVRRSQPSVRFPAGLLLAATWNRDLARDQGISMGVMHERGVTFPYLVRAWIFIVYQWVAEISST